MTDKQPIYGVESSTATFRPGITPQEQLPVNTEPTYIPVLHGKATDFLANLNGGKRTPDAITGSLTLESNGVKAVIEKANELAVAGGINVHKLLSVGIGEFARINNIGGDNPNSSITYGVAIPLKGYATKLGYKVTPQLPAGTTPEERSAEKSRADNVLKRARKKIKEDLKLLSSLRLSWEEKVKGKSSDFISYAIVGSTAIRNGYIYMVFDPLFAEYLLRLPMTQYAEALLKIDARNPNAYLIGYKMILHFFIDNNQRGGTAQQLKVKTLLKETNLPDISTVRKQRKNWEERIKEPLENALDTLYSTGIISEWYYSKSKGEQLTDEEATRFTYESWAETNIHFILRNAPDQTERLERKAQSIEEAKAKKKKRSSKKKPTE